MKIDAKIRSLISDSKRSLKERVFIVLTITAMGIAMFALIGDIIYSDNIIEIMVLIATMVFTPVTTFCGVKFQKIDTATRVISLGLIFVIMPITFIFGGGIEGGGIPWLVFSYLYVGLVLSGWWRAGMLASLTVIIIILFSVGYYHPELVYHHSGATMYLDSALAVIEVGYVCFVMTWFQNLLFLEENKRAREETKKVEELNMSQNRFFSSMSHELRTPINSILGLNEIILRQPDASDEIIRDAGNIQGAGRMLLALINDILDFSKIEAGKMDIVPVNYNIASLVSEIVNMMWMRVEQKGIELKIEIDPSVPVELFGDEVRIKQILVNLLNNAVKYTNHGTVTLHVEKEDIIDNQVVLMFSVIDTGMGIKQDAIPYLFDAFQRVDEEKNSRIEGTGLGLSIVKQLVDLMGGRVTVNSVYGQGSTFTVTLRQKVTNSDAVGNINITELSKSERAGGYEAEFTAPEARILIVDDNEMNLEVERKLLIGTEISVDTVKSGEQALVKTLTEHYDVILMDHLMPEMDGIECLQRIRKQVGGLNNRIPVIVLTANAGSENTELYARSGFDDYLVKPVSAKQLEDKLLLHLPQTKIVTAKGTDITKLSMNTARGYSRKLPVLVTTGSLCDLPKSVLKQYQIDTIPFIIRGNGNTYYDGVEAETDELLRYMKEGAVFSSEPASVEAYEKFFGEELKKAHNVIYVAVSSAVSHDYEHAFEAAKSYENVKVFDSKTNSSALGMLVLLAQRMSARGSTVERIIEELQKASESVHCGVIADGSYFVHRIDAFGKGVEDIMRTLSIWPYIRYKNGKYAIGRLSLGERERCYMKFVDYALPRVANPDLDVIFVVYSDQSVSDLAKIEMRIKKRFKFKNIVFQKSSAVLALNCGSGAFGLMYFDKGEYSYNLSSMLVSEDDYEEEQIERMSNDVEYEAENDDNISVDSLDNNESYTDKTEWFIDIDGIDYESAIASCGSEDSLKAVLEIFHESIDERASELEGYYNAEDWDNYTIKVHAMKSSARLIGATGIADDAQALENAGKEHNIDYINEHHAGLIKAYRDLEKPLDEIFGAVIKEVEDSPEEISDTFIQDDFIDEIIESVYEVIREGASSQDVSMIESALAEVEEYEIPEIDMDRLDILKGCLERQAFDEIIKVIDNIAR
ncbi:MAG: DegV family EDD domain-containing protein [Lachnospiraceae bacterium]|jgi:DegV family protein with EDD domain|nr:DegV family EDD domain-containing protein [Lachnospiraceae bacterium]